MYGRSSSRSVWAMTSLPNCGACGGVPSGRSGATSSCWLTRRQSSLPRGNLDQLGELFLGQRRSGVLECDGIRNDRVETNDLVRVHRRLGEEVVAGSFGHVDGNADEFR